LLLIVLAHSASVRDTRNRAEQLRNELKRTNEQQVSSRGGAQPKPSRTPLTSLKLTSLLDKHPLLERHCRCLRRAPHHSTTAASAERRQRQPTSEPVSRAVSEKRGVSSAEKKIDITLNAMPKPASPRMLDDAD